jgi:hypothetical protein
VQADAEATERRGRGARHAEGAGAGDTEAARDMRERNGVLLTEAGDGAGDGRTLRRAHRAGGRRLQAAPGAALAAEGRLRQS